MPRTFHIVTFGCQMNDADSEQMAGELASRGHRPTSDSRRADLVLINTCSVRAKAEGKALSLLGRWLAYKRRHPDLLVGLCGCVAEDLGLVPTGGSDFHGDQSPGIRLGRGFGNLEVPDEIAAAMAGLYREDGLAVEGGGAVGVAALMAGKVEPTPGMVVVVSGGNVAEETLREVLQT